MRITKKDILLYKEYHNGHRIIHVRFLNEDFVFRTLTKSEYRLIRQMELDAFEEEEMICNLACIFPEGYDFGTCSLAGLPEVVAARIKKESGFLSMQDNFLTLRRQREQTSTFENQCILLVKAYLPEYTIQEMKEWTWDRLLEAVAFAEELAKLRGMDHHHIVDEVDEEKEDGVGVSNEEYITYLIEQGIDPMLQFKEDYVFKKELIEEPFIGGIYWENGEMLDAIRAQIRTKTTTR